MIDETRIRDLVRQLATEVGFTLPTDPPVDQPPTSTLWPVRAGASLQAACDTAPAGSTITIEPGTYQGNIRVGSKPLVIRPTVALPPGQARREFAPVTLVGNGPATVSIAPGKVVQFQGIRVQNTNADGTLIEDLGTGTILDRILALGDPKAGQHRGVTAHGQGCMYTDCFVDDCGLVGRDAQALSGWDGTRDLLVRRSYLGGGAQSVMFGGADATSADRIPTGIVLQQCVLGKNPAWYKLGWQIKTSFELKCAKDVVVRDTECLYAGVSGGQSAYTIVLTPRNQNGQATWSTVSNVLFERVRCQYGGGGVLMLGSDDTVGKPSGPLENVTFRDVAFLDLDPKSPVWTQPTATPPHLGSGRIFSVAAGPQGGPKRVTIDGVTATGTNIASPFYVIGAGPTGLVVKNYLYPATKYGWKIDGGATGPEGVKALCPDAVIDLSNSTGAQGYPRQGA